jgi:hypothetical protein
MSNPQHDPRVMMTTRIWGMAVAMLAICVPMIEISDDLVPLPVLVILGTVASTFVVWRSAGRQSDDSTLLSYQLRELQQQLARLEISSTDDDLRRRIEEISLRQQQR